MTGNWKTQVQSLARTQFFSPLFMQPVQRLSTCTFPYFILSTNYTYLCDTDGADAHPYPEGIHANINEILSLLSGDHVTPDDLEVRVLLFNVLYHVDLEYRVPL